MIRTVFFDLETTGLSTKNCKIIEIAAYCVDTKKHFTKLVNPDMNIPPVITKITNINDSMVKNEDLFKNVIKTFEEFCFEGNPDKVVLIAHNGLKFDKMVLLAEYERNEIPLPNYIFYDSIDWFKKIYPDEKSYKLSKLQEKFQVNYENTHRALDDTMCLFEIFDKSRGNFSYEEIYDKINLLR